MWTVRQHSNQLNQRRGRSNNFHTHINTNNFMYINMYIYMDFHCRTHIHIPNATVQIQPKRPISMCIHALLPISIFYVCVRFVFLRWSVELYVYSEGYIAQRQQKQHCCCLAYCLLLQHDKKQKQAEMCILSARRHVGSLRWKSYKHI